MSTNNGAECWSKTIVLFAEIKFFLHQNQKLNSSAGKVGFFSSFSSILDGETHVSRPPSRLL